MRLAEQIPDTISCFESQILFLLALPSHFWRIHPGKPYGNVLPNQRVKAGNVHAAGVSVIAGAVGDVGEIVGKSGNTEDTEKEEGQKDDHKEA